MVTNVTKMCRTPPLAEARVEAALDFRLLSVDAASLG